MKVLYPVLLGLFAGVIGPDAVNASLGHHPARTLLHGKIHDIDTRDHARSRVAFVHIADWPVGDLTGTDSVPDLNMLATVNLHLYCQRHGYDYIRYVVPAPVDRKAHWLQPMYVSHVIKHYEITVMLDFDVFLRDDSLPLPDLLAKLGFRDDTLVLQALDPFAGHNMITLPNGTRTVQGNAGFMVFRQHDRVLKMIQDWLTCPDLIPGCNFTTHEHFVEQDAWNLFIRPKFTSKELVLVPCDLANGYGFGEFSECSGRFVSHWWLAKWELSELLRAKLLKHYVAQQLEAVTVRSHV